MVLRRFIIFMAVGIVVGGCVSSGGKPKNASHTFYGRPTGQLVNKKAFIKKGSLAVLPFKAGENAEADPQLDRMSLMISKGIIDYCKEQNLPFTLLLTQDQGSPDMVVEGYIENFTESSRFDGLFFRPRKFLLTVNGELTVLDSKERILVFKQTKTMTGATKNGLDLSYQAGLDLGRFIVDAVEGQ